MDHSKDPSYVLASLSQAQLAQTLFPIGELAKTEVRRLAHEYGLSSVADKPESQDLCFIPDGDTSGFLKKHLPADRPGEIVESDGTRLGEHQGLGTYTIGQRKGLGIATGKPRYVLELRVASNQLVVGDPDELLRSRMEVEELNWIQDFPQRAWVKYRHQTPGADAVLTPLGEDRLTVSFDTPQSALTPGQVSVFYHGDEVLGGGTIASIL